MRNMSRLRLSIAILFGIGAAAGAVLFGCDVQTAFAGGSSNPFLPVQASTIPANGDTNPYGLAFVPAGFPGSGSAISPGKLLVSNFNNSNAVAGQGETIITVNPFNGQTGLFFQGSTAIGFTNALTVARAGLVFAGSLPTSGGTPLPGPLDVFDRNGNLLTQLGSTDLVDGPWGMALNDNGSSAQLFISNIFDTNGNFAGSITRLDVSLSPTGITVNDALTIASGYFSATDTTATVIGPAGLAYDAMDDILYVAAEGDNKIFKLKGAGSTTQNLGTGTVVFSDSTVLHGPLGLIIAPNGDLVTANDDPTHFLPSATDPSEIIEITPRGKFVREFSIDPNPGSAFAIQTNQINSASDQFVYVDDFTNDVTIWTVPDNFE